MDEVVSNSQNLHLMQYTGLKDKNGKEIYEGDIVKHEHPYKKEPEIKEIYFDEELCEFGLRMSNALLHRQFSDEFEVIGNIYENPELIHEKL